MGRYRFLLKGYKLGADPGKNTSSNNFYNNVMANRSVFTSRQSRIPAIHLLSLIESGITLKQDGSKNENCQTAAPYFVSTIGNKCSFFNFAVYSTSTSRNYHHRALCDTAGRSCRLDSIEDPATLKTRVHSGMELAFTRKAHASSRRRRAVIRTSFWQCGGANRHWPVSDSHHRPTHNALRVMQAFVIAWQTIKTSKGIHREFTDI